ncbi:MW1434 family type I TA system toxin [Sporofaciens sp. JLR.KK001]|uniref:Thoeris anti-defense Tad2 family protein n=1 Tax=Sporofaciens sp. JLR.KK001 TaxID=3112621 RepID=UPI002FF33A81
MNIQEATKKAVEDGGLIYRTSTMQANKARHGAVNPTNTYDACILVVMEKGVQKKSCRAWNPTADDLLADDWEVAKE